VARVDADRDNPARLYKYIHTYCTVRARMYNLRVVYTYVYCTGPKAASSRSTPNSRTAGEAQGSICGPACPVVPSPSPSPSPTARCTAQRSHRGPRDLPERCWPWCCGGGGRSARGPGFNEKRCFVYPSRRHARETYAERPAAPEVVEELAGDGGDGQDEVDEEEERVQR
jgi:hypothetical protein